MNNDTQLINPNLVSSLSEVMKNEKEAKEELYNSVINLFNNNKDAIKELLTKFNTHLYNLDGDPILFNPNDHSQLLISYTNLFSITRSPILFDLSNNKFLIFDTSSKKNAFLTKEQAILFLSNQEYFNLTINVADPNKLLSQSCSENTARLSELYSRLRYFYK